MLAILLFLIFGNPTNKSNDAVFAVSFLDQVNAVRRAGCLCEGKHMPPVGKVIWHPKLEVSAVLHAQQMLRYRFLEHYSIGGLDIGQRANAVGYPWRTIGENLGRGQVSIHEVIEDWIESPSHCHVLMNPKFKEMGAAHKGEYWVLHMGVRKDER
jgi:uncharacterized protein YkwD